MSKITIQGIDFNNLKPEDVFTWLELFTFKRYGERYYLDPSKRDDPRYPAKQDESPIDWYTHLAVPSQYYNKTCIIIDEELYNKIKQAFLKKRRQRGMNIYEFLEKYVWKGPMILRIIVLSIIGVPVFYVGLRQIGLHPDWGVSALASVTCVMIIFLWIILKPEDQKNGSVV